MMSALSISEWVAHQDDGSVFRGRATTPLSRPYYILGRRRTACCTGTLIMMIITMMMIADFTTLGPHKKLTCSQWQDAMRDSPRGRMAVGRMQEPMWPPPMVFSFLSGDGPF